MASLNRFILNSDYPVEQIVFYAQIEVTTSKYDTSNFGSATARVDYDLPFIPLPYAVASQYEDFSDSRGIDPSLMPDDSSDYWQISDLKAYADHMECKVMSQSPINRKVYVRFYGLRPPGEIGEVSPTSTQAGTFLLNTDTQYAPLICDVKIDGYSSGEQVVLNVSNGHKEETVTATELKIYHGLGAPAWVSFWALSEDDNKVPCIIPKAASGIWYQGYYDYITQSFDDYIFVTRSEGYLYEDVIYVKAYANV